MLTADILATATGATLPRARAWLDPITAACAVFGIGTPQRLAAFLAQVGHESACLSAVVENLNYSAAGLLATWPTRFDRAAAASYARQPEHIANKVYANRMGNGNEASGDGWRYRGRGLIQLTGRDNYRAVTAGLRSLPCGDRFPDFELAPELLELPEWAAMSAAWYWHQRGLNELADAGDIDAITRRINGGMTGAAARRALYVKALAALT